ncbi:MAG: HDIG domain-containing protein [Marinifilaceae bacterium]|nr:HDIG domain-containing protein [Marinifilaceae bacterium]
MDVDAIINKFYDDNAEGKAILVVHSKLVTEIALEMAERHPELNIDAVFVSEAAMLHDIGIYLCSAPSIGCYGSEPYIKHGVLGAELLRREGFERHARVCERHTGTGLSKESILAQELPLPIQDFLPETIEEKLICFADKFFSKSRPSERKSVEEARKSISKFGIESLQRFDEWCELFL